MTIRLLRTGGRSGAHRRMGVAGALLVAAVLLSGCGGDGGDDNGNEPPGARVPATDGDMGAAPPASSPPELTEDQAKRSRLVPAAKTTYEDAARIAMEKVPGSRLYSAELQGEPPQSPAMWEAEVAAADGTLHKVFIDAGNGNVNRTEMDQDQDGDDKRKVNDRLNAVKVTYQDAGKIATKRTPGVVTTIDLGDEAGKTVWKTDVVTTDRWEKHTYDIDAMTGDVVREQVDRD